MNKDLLLSHARPQHVNINVNFVNRFLHPMLNSFFCWHTLSCVNKFLSPFPHLFSPRLLTAEYFPDNVGYTIMHFHSWRSVMCNHIYVITEYNYNGHVLGKEKTLHQGIQILLSPRFTSHSSFYDINQLFNRIRRPCKLI